MKKRGEYWLAHDVNRSESFVPRKSSLRASTTSSFRSRNLHQSPCRNHYLDSHHSLGRSCDAVENTHCPSGGHPSSRARRIGRRTACFPSSHLIINVEKKTSWTCSRKTWLIESEFSLGRPFCRQWAHKNRLLENSKSKVAAPKEAILMKFLDKSTNRWWVCQACSIRDRNPNPSGRSRWPTSFPWLFHLARNWRCCRSFSVPQRWWRQRRIRSTPARLLRIRDRKRRKDNTVDDYRRVLAAAAAFPPFLRLRSKHMTNIDSRNLDTRTS